MNEDTIADLKQFIAGQITQQTSDIRDDIKKLDKKIDKVDQRLSEKIDNLELKVDTILNHVGETMEEDKTLTTAQLKDHETRITKLETKPA